MAESQPPMISAIVPTYNRAEVLPIALNSILAQTYKDFEVIVVDDGSTDSTGAVLKPYLERPNFKYIFQENKKQAAARNRGISEASGKYIAFLDSDDFWYPKKLELQLRILEDNPEIGMVSSNQLLFDPEGIKIGIRYPNFASQNVYRDLLLRKFYCSVQACLVRLQVFESIGLFDESLGDSLEDWELSLRIARVYSIHLMPEPLVGRKITTDSNSEYAIKRCRNHRKILDRYLTPDSLDGNFIRRVWRHAYFSWGHIYLINHHYKGALNYFSRALSKRHIGGGLGIILCFFGPYGARLLDNLLHWKSRWA